MRQSPLARPTHWAETAHTRETAPKTRHFGVITGGLAVKPQGRLKPKIRYAVIIMIGMAAILGAQLSISVLLAQGAYEIDTLQGELKESSRTAESIGEDIALLTSPQYLAANATELGMVPTRDVTFLRLSDGKVMGSLAVAGSRGPIANPKVQNQLLNQESQYLAGILGTTVTTVEDGNADTAGSMPAAAPGLSEIDSETPSGLTPVAEEAPVVSNADSRGLTPTN